MKASDFYYKLTEEYDTILNKSGVSGERLAQRLSMISEIGRTPEGGSNRIGFSKEEEQAKQLAIKWMTEAGLKIRRDAAGNVFGRLEGKNKALPTLLSGSHLDTVPNGGHFDGVLGVLTALEVVEAWKETGYIPNYPFEVVVFSDEEGSRFNDGFTGSRAFIGLVDMEEQRRLVDDEGKGFDEVLRQVGLDSNQFLSAKRDIKEIEAFIEVHIEQGLYLEKSNIPIGIVNGIAGASWLEITFTGNAGHAGTTPMLLRNDPLVAAGEFINRVSYLPQEVSPTAVATIGKVDVKPNGINVIPGEVTLFVDIRDINKDSRDKLISLICDTAVHISKKYRTDLQYKVLLEEDPVPINDEIKSKFKKSAKENGLEPGFLPSGAGHDAMILGQIIPIGMLFIRSKDGISHNPKEWSSLNDCVLGVHTLKCFLENY